MNIIFKRKRNRRERDQTEPERSRRLLFHARFLEMVSQRDARRSSSNRMQIHVIQIINLPVDQQDPTRSYFGQVPRY